MDEWGKRFQASYLLPDPGGAVVREMLNEISAKDETIKKLADCIIEKCGLDGCLCAPETAEDAVNWLRSLGIEVE